MASQVSRKWVVFPWSCVAACFLLLLATAGWAATFTVSSSGDTHDIAPGDGIAGDHANPDSSATTLRAAVEEAGALPGPDTILVPSAFTPIQLSLGSITVSGQGTCIMSAGDPPVIDGLGNPVAATSLILTGDSSSVAGFVIKRSRGHGVLITGSGNTIGNNTFIGNGIDNPHFAGVAIVGETARGNRLVGNLIGVHGNGATIDGNRIGVLLSLGANGNVIGDGSEASRNIISGNEWYGVLITGNTAENTVTGNVIGPDITGSLEIGVQRTGILLSDGAHDNSIGGPPWPSGNLISGNAEAGVVLDGPEVRANVISGNVIGMDMSANLALPNGGDGVAIIGGAHCNWVGDQDIPAGNYISGNKGSGVRIAGWSSDSNRVVASVIGLDHRGYRSVGNGSIEGAGVLIEDSARHNAIGGSTDAERNVISGNTGYGVYIRGLGTDSNTVSGNFIGPAPSGSNYASNLIGVVISDGAEANTIGGDSPDYGNTISGNSGETFPDGAGVFIRGTGTSRNRVSANIIGLGPTGASAMGNDLAGVLIGDGASGNTVGGLTAAMRNVITANGSGTLIPGISAGVHIYGSGTTHNDIIGNFIGPIANGTVAIGNYGSNVGVYLGAKYNRIGGDSAACGNVIAEAETEGVLIDGFGTVRNLIRHNRIYDNDRRGIRLNNYGNGGIAAPLLLTATTTQATGVGGAVGGLVDIYIAAPDTSGYGEGAAWAGSAAVRSDGSFTVLLDGVAPGDTLTAITVDAYWNSSAFARNIVVGGTSVDDPSPGGLPTAFALSQNYPNPFNPETVIRYALPTAERVMLRVHNALGQTVATLVDQPQEAGWYSVRWSGLTADGRPVASGLYLYCLEAGAFRESRKMILLR